ncbi:MAG: chloride channel protein [Pseudomonadota bacterium]
MEGIQGGFLPGGDPENYEALDWRLRWLLPLLGGVLLALMFRWLGGGLQVLGVARVMERMAYHQGHMTRRGFVLQFLGAAIAIISGHSVGREGPHVYLGAASGSFLGQWLALPNNSIRTLVGCGTAAGIAASFNTPLAGVIFALEVVMLEYTLASFVPVILAAATATLVSGLVFGTGAVLSVEPMKLASFADVGLVVLLGLAVGVVASGFNQLLESTAAAGQRLQIWWRLCLAGILAGLAGWLVPEVMGIGYDTVARVLYADVAVGTLALLVVAKVVATAASVGLGVPGGMIGPSLFIGACLGGLAGWAGQQLGAASDPGFFALIGMGAMMGASLQAPLAALTAILELSHSPGVLMPGMLAVILASLVVSEIFRKESLFVTMLKAGGLDYRASPVRQALRRVGVAGVMNASFTRCERRLEVPAARGFLDTGPAWLLVGDREGPRFLLRAVDLASHLESNGDTPVDMEAIPATRLDVAPVQLQATLQEAVDILDGQGVEALYVERTTAPGIKHIYGILTRDMVESAYKY